MPLTAEALSAFPSGVAGCARGQLAAQSSQTTEMSLGNIGVGGRRGPQRAGGKHKANWPQQPRSGPWGPSRMEAGRSGSQLWASQGARHQACDLPLLSCTDPVR